MNALLLAPMILAAQEGTDVFTDRQAKTRMLTAYFERMSAPRNPAFASREQWEKRRAELRANVMRDLGLDPLPERVALKPHVSATKDYDDFRLERVWFQTFPEVWASGWLYVPKTAAGGKHPAVLNPHGHWPSGAREPVVQSRCIGLAKLGYVAMSVDAVHETDWPTGLCPAGYMTWNNIRALDYLESRPEVDKTKIGCTGESGGGQQTMYLMAVDDRIQAAVPVVLISYFRRILFPTEQAHCWCNHVPGMLRDADEPEISALFAPKPALFISTTQDWTARFPDEEFPPIKSVYAKLGAADRVDSKLHQVPHGYERGMREQMYAWFNRWLRGIDDPKAAVEPMVRTETPDFLARLDSPPAGNRGGEGAKAYFRKTIDSRRKEPLSRDRVLSLLGEEGALQTSRKPSAIATGEWRGHGMEKVTFGSEAEFEIPAVVLRPKGKPARAPAAILISDGGKKDVLEARAPLVEDLLARGWIVLAADVRLSGELKYNWHLNAVVWGRPEAGMAAHDVKCAVDYLRGRADVNPERIFCAGFGDMGVAALLSGVVDPRMAGIAAEDLGRTYGEGRQSPVIPNLLRYGDLADVASLLAPRPLWIGGAAEPAFDAARVAYVRKNAAKAFRFGRAGDLGEWFAQP